MISADTSTIDLNIDANTLYVDSSANRVGIGTNSPIANLDVVRGGATGLSSINARTTLLLQNNNSAGTVLSINAPNTGYSGIFLGDPQSEAQGQIKQVHTDNSMQFTSSAGTAEMTLKAGNIGLGTTSPNSYTNQRVLTIDGTTHSRVDFETGGTLRGSLYGDSTSLNVDAGGNYLRFYTGNTERMRISSAGTVLVGKTAEGTATDGIELNRNDVIVVTRNGDSPLILNRRTSDGDIAVFRKDNTVVGSIGARAGDLTIGTGNCGLIFNDGTEIIIPANITTNTVADATVDLGYSAGRFKDLHLSGTAGVNALDIKSGSAIHGTITTSSSSLTLNARNTGIMIFQSGGSEKARINASGRLGVGTTTPNANLHISSLTAVGTQANPAIQIGASSTYRLGFYTDAEGGIIENKNGDNGLQFKVKTAGEVMRIMPSGSVGIGTTSAFTTGGTAGLSISGSSVLLSMGASNTDLTYFRRTSSGNYQIQTYASGNTGELELQPYGGKVGIGITDPDQALEIGAGGKLKLSRADNSRSMLLYTNNADCVIQSDTDPLHLQSANRMTFATNGASERMRIATDGKIGIGTAAPAYPFDVYGTDDLQMRIHRPSSSLGLNDTCGIGFSQRGDTNTSTSDTRAAIVSTYNGSLHLCTEPGGNLNSNPVDHAALSIVGTNQKVGIGTTSPRLKFHVQESTAEEWIADFVHSHANAYGVRVDLSGTTSSTRYALGLYTGGGVGMFVRNNGTVGIGVNTPVVPLNIQSDSGANAIRIIARSGNDHGFLSFYANDNSTVWSEISGSAGSLRFYTAASNEKMRIEADGDVGIGMTDTQGSKLGVAGSLRLSGGSNDLASITTGTGSIVGSGSITHTIGYAGTYPSGKKWVWTYAATTWKSFHVTLRVSGTAGFSTYEGGGYNNNGGPMDTVEHGNDLGSFEVTRNGQNMIMTYTASTQTIHPFFELTYRQSGGDGSPYMDRLSLVQS